eukprot:1840315-Alexandrium_andersonii.AAC.1
MRIAGGTVGGDARPPATDAAVGRQSPEGMSTAATAGGADAACRRASLGRGDASSHPLATGRRPKG